MTGFFIIMPSLIVGFLAGCIWERFKIKIKKKLGIKEKT